MVLIAIPLTPDRRVSLLVCRQIYGGLAQFCTCGSPHSTPYDCHNELREICREGKKGGNTFSEPCLFPAADVRAGYSITRRSGPLLPQIICVTKRNKDDMYIKHTKLGFGRRLGPTYVGTAPKRKKGKRKTMIRSTLLPPKTESVNPSNPMTYHTKSKKEKRGLMWGGWLL